MGVRFGREYQDIIEEFVVAIQEVDSFYQFLEITSAQWQKMNKDQQRECAKTLADDLFYGLGETPVIDLEGSTITYDQQKHVITVSTGEQFVRVIQLT